MLYALVLGGELKIKIQGGHGRCGFFVDIREKKLDRNTQFLLKHDTL